MPLSVGSTRTQSPAGSSGSGTSPRCSRDSALVATSGLPPEAFTMANEGIERWKVRANTRPSSSDGFFEFRGARVWHRQAPVPRRHAPPIDAPAALAGHLRKARVWDHGDRRADELEHPQGREPARPGQTPPPHAYAATPAIPPPPAPPPPRPRRG